MDLSYIEANQGFVEGELDKSGYGDPYKNYPKGSILRKLYRRQVVGIGVEDGCAVFQEACDHHYSVELSATELRTLIAELSEVARLLETS